MEINIESSLAAMAFVLADQQDTIKQYREERSTWQHDLDIANAATAEKIEELERCEKEIHRLHEEMEGLNIALTERTADMESLRRDVDSLCVELEQNRIQWRAVDPENTGRNTSIIVPPEVLERKAVILVKNKVISDGIATVDCRPIAVGSYFLTTEYAQMGTDGGFYILFEPSKLSIPVQYAVVPCLAEKEVFDV